MNKRVNEYGHRYVTLEVHEFIEILGKCKLSKPQEYIYNRLKRGDRLGTVNTHRMSGGEIVWVRDGEVEPAGHIYRALYSGLWEQVRKYLKKADPKVTNLENVTGLYIPTKDQIQREMVRQYQNGETGDEFACLNR